MNPTGPGPQPEFRPATVEQAPSGGIALSTIANWLLFFPLVCVYVFIVQFGSLLRSSASESAPGPSTYIVLALIALGAGRIVRAFATEKLVFWTLAILVVYTAITSPLTSRPADALAMTRMLAGYILLAAAISRTRWHRSQISTLWFLMAAGLLVSSSLTIVDYVGFINVPYANELDISTEAVGLDVEQASGFFVKRSAMAAYFGLSATGSLVLALTHESFRARLYYFTAASSGLLCLFLTHNRSGVFGAIIAIGIYILISPRFNGSRRVNILLASMIAGGMLLAGTATFFPEHLSVYVAKLGFIGLADEAWASDGTRIDLFVAAVKSIAVNPLGNGFTKILLSPGRLISAHNIVTAIIWALGAFAFLWLPLFSAAVYLSLTGRPGNRSNRIPLSVESDALTFGLLGWLLNGMTHNIIFTGLAWVVFGIMLSIRYFGDLDERKREATR